MRLSKLRNSSIMRKLTVTFAAVVVAAALLISVPLYGVYSHLYNGRVQEMNRHLVAQYARHITDTVVDPVVNTYIDLYLNMNNKTDIGLLFQPRLLSGNAYTIGSELLTLTSASRGLMEGIHIYSSVQDVVVSSVLGLKYNHPTNRLIWPEVAMITGGLQMDGRTHWTGARTLHYATSHGVDVVSFVGAYPVSRRLQEAIGCVSIDIRVSYLSDLLEGLTSGITGDLILFGGDGTPLAHTAAQPLIPPNDGWGDAARQEMLRASATGGTLNVSGQNVLVSCSELANGWMLANVVTLDAFNAATGMMALWVFGIMAVVVLLCILISSRLVNSVTAPLNAIIARTRTLLSRAKNTHSESNEFTLIDAALTEQSARIATLNQAWENSLPAIKQNLLRNLISQGFTSVQAFEKQAGAFGKLPADGRCGFLLLNLLEREDSQNDSEVVNAVLVRHLEELSGPGMQVIAGELSMQCVGALIVAENPLLESRLEEVVAFAKRTLEADLTVSIGSWQEGPLTAWQSYQDALEAGEAYFFSPWQSVFAPRAASPQAEEEAHKALRRQEQQFKNALVQTSQDKLAVLVQVFASDIAAAPLRCKDKHAHLVKMAEILSEYAEDKVSVQDVFAVRYPQDSVTDIHEYAAWLTKAVALVIGWKQDDGDGRARDIISGIKQYIAANLDKELSLTTLSEYTALSNNYISYVFKEKTGIGLVDYITQERMERARELLGDTTKTIESIARQLGYHTPHYFTKRFRQYYGQTPQQYRHAL